MEGLSRSPSRPLCQLEELADGTSSGFPAPPGGFSGLFAVRRDGEVFVYVNSCPHIGTLWTGCRTASSRPTAAVSFVRPTAPFRVADGECLSGPCLGDRLEAVAIEIRDGTVYVPEDAGL